MYLFLDVAHKYKISNCQKPVVLIKSLLFSLIHFAESEPTRTFIEDETVLRLDARPLDDDILRNGCIFSANAGHPWNVKQCTLRSFVK